MFETAQEESGAGAAKIVGGVIAVVAVLLVVVYFTFLRGAPAYAPGANTAGAAATQEAAGGGAAADAMKDLSIVKSDLHRDQATQTMAMWNIQVANRSKNHGYKDIHYQTNYYNGQDQVIYQNQGTLSDPIEPGDQRNYGNINDGLYPVGAVRYTIEIKGANPVQ